MPMYEYRCPHCDRRFEVLQRMGQGSEGVRCPDCRRTGVERLISTFAGHGGDGFAATGFGGGCGSGGFT
jgi:putative FmdB family regulatory protein